MRRNSSLLVLAILLSGCASPQPESVYVDLDRAVLAARGPETRGTPLPQPPAPSPALTVDQPGLSAITSRDLTRDRLEAAKRLIAENRRTSIQALSAMLMRVYLAEAEDQKAVEERGSQPARAAIVDQAFADLRTLFEAYGEQRGPPLAHLNVLARTKHIDLEPQPIPETADGIRQRLIGLANDEREFIRGLDAEYDAAADALLARARKDIADALAALDAADTARRRGASAKATREAESKAAETQSQLEVQLTQLVPSTFPAIPPHRATVAGTAPLPPAPVDVSKPLFGSLEQRRHLLDQEIDIWIRTTGRRRSMQARGVRDATELFLQWRSAHQVGP